MLCDPTCGNPCFATLPDNIHFIKFYPPLATHAFNDSSSSTTFLLSKFLPPLGNPCFATLPDNIPFIKFSPPLATHAFNDSSSSTTFLLSKIFPPPVATHALRPYLTTFLLSNSPPPLPTYAFNDSSSSTTFLSSIFSPSLGNPCFRWFKFKYNIPLIKFFPPLATHALRPYLTTFLLSNFPPLGNPCFQWFKFKYNIPFIQIFPPPCGNPCFATLPDNIPFHTATHSIQVRKRTTEKRSQRTAGNLATPCKTPGILFRDPTHLLFPLPTDRGQLRPYPSSFLLRLPRNCLALHVTGSAATLPSTQR